MKNIMSSVITVGLTALICLGMFAGTVHAAAAAAPSGGTLLDYARPVFEAIMAGHYVLSVALVVILMCALAKKYMPATWTTGTKGDMVGVSTAFMMAAVGAVATALAAPGAAVSGALMFMALKVGFAAIGGWTVMHKVLGWMNAWDAMPSWLRAALGMVGMLIGSDAIAKATAAGTAAVAAKPSTGLAGALPVKEVK